MATVGLERRFKNSLLIYSAPKGSRSRRNRRSYMAAAPIYLLGRVPELRRSSKLNFTGRGSFPSHCLYKLRHFLKTHAGAFQQLEAF